MKIKKIKASYVFNTFGFILLILSVILYSRFETAKEKIYSVNTEANLKYVKSLINNLSNDVIRVVQKNIKKSIYEDVILKEYIETDLKLFITTKYKRIYLVAKNDDDKVFILADSDDVGKDIHPHLKSHLKYVYDNQKFLYTEHTNNSESHGAEYVKPIIIDGIVEALIVVEFTLAEQKTITDELEALSEVLAFIILFLFIVFIFIIWFSQTDEKRELQKNIAFEELNKSNKQLELETEKSMS